MTLGQWFSARDSIVQMYQEELGRDVIADPDALTNWLYHLCGDVQPVEWVRDRIRESDEWRLRHGPSPPALMPQPAPQPPSPGPSPPGGGGVPLRVTTEQDGRFVHRMYSYWSNAWLSGRWAYVFAGHVDGRPRCFRVDLESRDVERGGWSVAYPGTTEGWSWTIEGEILLCDGPRLRRVNPFGSDDRILLDISQTHPAGCELWQPHASDDYRTLSATVHRVVSSGRYPRVGTVIAREGRQTFYAAEGDLDESQVDQAGRWVVIKETFPRGGKDRVDNRFLNLQTGADEWMRDEAGAFGHSDVGPGFIVGENDQIGACEWMDLATRQRRTLFSTWNMGHVSVRGDRCLVSDATHLALVALDGSGVTHLLNHGSRVSTGANLDPSGRVVTYMVNGAVYLLTLS